jgi:predicted RNA binding protein YcfA (HicA-like mRNA interferase family)
MSRTIRKDVAEVIKWAERRGFTLVGPTGSGHWKLRHPRCGVIIMAQTPGGGRWQQNAKSLIRRKLRNLPNSKDS